MFRLENYLEALIAACRELFCERLLYVGLQGSYLRGEAHEGSDIDVMVVLDRLTVQDMDAYREILQRIGQFERSCGFLCGKDELSCWNPLEICHLLHTTKDLYGTLLPFVPQATREDEIQFVKLGLGNLYHELCHRYVHASREKNVARFRSSCKGVFFLLQNLHYLETGTFMQTKAELKGCISAGDCEILALADLPDDYDFPLAFSMLFAWCKDAFSRIARLSI